MNGSDWRCLLNIGKCSCYNRVAKLFILCESSENRGLSSKTGSDISKGHLNVRKWAEKKHTSKVMLRRGSVCLIVAVKCLLALSYKSSSCHRHVLQEQLQKVRTQLSERLQFPKKKVSSLELFQLDCGLITILQKSCSLTSLTRGEALDHGSPRECNMDSMDGFNGSIWQLFHLAMKAKLAQSIG